MVRAFDSTKILYEVGQFWVCLGTRGYEVYKNGATHSTRVATIGKSLGFERAKAEADKRASSQ